MPEQSKLNVVQEVFNRRIVGQAIAAAKAIRPRATIVVCDPTGGGFGAGVTVT